MVEPRGQSIYINDDSTPSAAVKKSIARAVVFPHQSNGYVEDFYCFLSAAKTHSGECPVVHYYHDSVFDFSKRKPAAFLEWPDFTQHLLKVLAEMTAICEEYKL